MTKPLAGKHVAVLMGGLSSERAVSLVSGESCAGALERLGAQVSRVDAGRDLAAVLTALKPDVVFNALHGEWGEDGCVQGVLETLAIPYTHSGVLSSALAMDKAKSKAVLAAAGVTVPGGGLFKRFEAAAEHVMPPPYVVKPNAEGSSVGVFIVLDGANRPPQEIVAPEWTYGEEVMIEPYVRGKELAVAVMDGKALTVTDIVPKSGFYDYEAKYGDGGSEHILPAQIPLKTLEKAMELAERAHAALGCRGVTRSDLRYDDINDILVLLEVNTQPGMTPTSLVPEQAALKCVDFDSRRTLMPAALRGGSRVSAKPRARKPAGSKSRSQAKAPAGYAPAKLGAARGVGLSPQHALMGATGVLAFALIATLVTGDRPHKLSQSISSGVGGQFAHLGFRLKAVHVQGASAMATADILAAAGVYKDQPLLGLDLEVLRQRIEAVGWVKEARIVRLLPDTLVLAVVERKQLAVWQHGGQSHVIDDHGRIIPEARSDKFPTLPLIVG